VRTDVAGDDDDLPAALPSLGVGRMLGVVTAASPTVARRPSCVPLQRQAALVLVLGAVGVVAPIGCATTTTTEPAGDARSQPAWLPDVVGTLARDPALDEAAAVLCARDTDAVIDDDVRAAARVWDGRVTGVLAGDGDDARRQVAALFADGGLSHWGAAQGARPGGRPCFAAVGARRVLTVASLPPVSTQDTATKATLAVALSPRRTGLAYVLGPDGIVDRLPLAGTGHTQTLTLPSRRAGRHVVEVIVDEVGEDGVPRGAPEVALLWPYVRGELRLPPAPLVLFPDDGHDDVALTHRAEALVQRLRNEQLLEPLKISPLLATLATERAARVGPALGHRVDGEDPRAALARFGDDPRAQFLRLSEVQARGSTLDDAWQALVDSPAHRYELVAVGVTHMGVAVVRGVDALGREHKTMVTLLGRRPPTRDASTLQRKLLDDHNALRTARGLDTLVVSDTLEATAARLARRMMEVGRVDDTLLGGPVGEVALEADASMTRVQPLVARIDDPLLLGPLPLLLDMDTTALGAGLALHPTEGVFYVCVLAGTGGG
jgi:uncharacterized protein YkwD